MRSMVVKLLKRRRHLMMTLVYHHQDRRFLGGIAWLAGMAWRQDGKGSGILE